MFPLCTPYDRKRIRFDALRPIRTIIPLDFNEFLSVRYIVSIALQSYAFVPISSGEVRKSKSA